MRGGSVGLSWAASRRARCEAGALIAKSLERIQVIHGLPTGAGQHHAGGHDPRPRASAVTTGCLPRSRISRHCRIQRRMKIAGHAAPDIVPCRRLIEGLEEDRRASRFLGAEAGRHRAGKPLGRADDRIRLWTIGSQSPDQGIGIDTVIFQDELRAVGPFRARHSRLILPASGHSPQLEQACEPRAALSEYSRGRR